MVRFGTLEYYKQFAELINKDEEVSKSGFSTTILYVFADQKTEEGVEKAFFFKLDEGKVTEVREAKPDEKAEIVYTANYKILAGIASGEIDAMDAIKSKAAKAKFPMIKLLRYKKTLDRIGKIAEGISVEY